jgi:hypothetical protein
VLEDNAATAVATGCTPKSEVYLVRVGDNRGEAEKEMAGVEVFNLKPVQVRNMLLIEQHVPASGMFFDHRKMELWRGYMRVASAV